MASPNPTTEENKKDSLHFLIDNFNTAFHTKPEVITFAPGRIEILGNHTDYNQGWVLSSAIDLGIHFLTSRSQDSTCQLIALDLQEQEKFDISDTTKSPKTWANFVKGMFVLLSQCSEAQGKGKFTTGFNCLFSGDLPRGAGLSSSAALAMSGGLALTRLYNLDISRLELAKIGQKVENGWVGVMSGLLDQFSSLFGEKDKLVLSDFRTLEVETVELGKEQGEEGYCFLIFNTQVHHNLVDSEYNTRRNDCEEAKKFFASVLPEANIQALRDVSWEQWKKFSPQMDPRAAKRAAHVVGEDERVQEGKALLREGKVREFGKLMFASHESSQIYFENSCQELDVLVDILKRIDAGNGTVCGARLSGGGFGGSVVALTKKRHADEVRVEVEKEYESKTSKVVQSFVMLPAQGATVLQS